MTHSSNQGRNHRREEFAKLTSENWCDSHLEVTYPVMEGGVWWDGRFEERDRSFGLSRNRVEAVVSILQ